jgi:hypothetical protein
MPYVIGVVLGLFVALLSRFAGFDRDRALYPAILIVIAWYYVLFAVMGDSSRAIGLESAGMLVFTAVAVVGFRSNLWWVAAGTAGHGLFDSVHDRLIANPGMPAWWPAFCGTIDVALAVWLATLLIRGRVRPR